MQRFGALAVVALILGIAATATAQPFTSIVVFGDSLSDGGQFGGFTFTEPNPDGTAGAVAVEILATGLGLVLTPSNPLIVEQRPPANNYAVAGNKTQDILDSIVSESVVDSERAGIPGFVSRRPGYLVEFPRADPTTLFVVSGGANDLRPGHDPTEAAGNLLAGVAALHGAGARYILVMNLPDLGSIPESWVLGNGQSRAQATGTFNEFLRTGLNASGANVIQMDVFSLLNEVLADPAAYGFSAVDQSRICFDGAAFTRQSCPEDPINGVHGSAPDPSRLVFYDAIHPTQAMHAIGGAYALSLIAAPGLILTLGEVPLTSARDHQLAIQNGLDATALAGTTRKWSLFGGGSLGESVLDATDEAPAVDNDGASVTGGVAYGVNDQVVTGVALGFTRSEIDDDGRGGFDLDSRFVSGFGRYRHPWFYADALATVASLDYTNVVRTVDLGTARRAEMGSTGGNQFALRLDFGANLLRTENTSLGPIVSLQVQNVNVDAYREAGSRSTSMNFSDQARRSRLGQVGIAGRYRFGGSARRIQVRGAITRDEELHDDPHDVRAGVNSLAGSSFSLPGLRPEEGAWTVRMGLDAELRPNLATSVSYVHRNGDTYLTENLVVIGVQFGM